MADNPLIQCFKSEFDRFFELLKKQVEVCPQDLWTKKVGGYIFWQQQLHAVMCVGLIYVEENDDIAAEVGFSREVIMLSAEPSEEMSKEGLFILVEKVHKLAHTFMSSINDADLTKKHTVMSKTLGREMSNQNALIAMTRHCCYHLGCCDAILREHGIKGVY